MPPPLTTVDKGTNTNDWDEYSEIKKLTEANSKLMMALESERDMFRFFLNGMLRNLASQENCMSESLGVYRANIVEHGKIIKNADVCKSITLRQFAPEVMTGTNESNEESPTDIVHDFGNLRPYDRYAQERRVAEIRPFLCHVTSSRMRGEEERRDNWKPS